MDSRFSRSWQMVKHSASLLQQDRELLVFPFLSSFAALLVLISFIPLFALDAAAVDEQNPVNVIALGLLYLAEYFVIFFFNTALVGAALIRMDGGDPTVRDGLRIAWSKIGHIFGYCDDRGDSRRLAACDRRALRHDRPHDRRAVRRGLDRREFPDGTDTGQPRHRTGRCGKGKRLVIETDLGRERHFERRHRTHFHAVLCARLRRRRSSC